ncbi:MAG: N-acetylglucosamine-6-phosphate deacetylase [Mycobacteriales bacterium]
MIGVVGGTRIDALPDGPAAAGDLVLVDGRIGEPDGAPARRADATGLLVAPALLDLQCNGFGGIDLTLEPERLWEVGTHLPRFGVGAFLPTLVSAGDVIVVRAQRALAQRPDGYRGAEPLGLHLEGPLLAKVRRGAHAAEAVRALADTDTASWSRRAGVVCVTLAPELPGVLDLVNELSQRDVLVSLGHSDATAEQASAAVDAGARSVTHLFNAMRPFGHRDPGLAGVGLADLRLSCGLIADGLHCHPTAVAAAWRALAPDRAVLVTDSVAAAGGRTTGSTLGRERVVLEGDAVRTRAGVLAGSTLTLDAAVRNLIRWTGCSPAAAVRAATRTPADLIGCSRKGRLEPGADADVVLLHPDLTVAATVLRGEVVHGEVRWRS